MKRKIFFNLIIVAISVILAGCAVGNKHAYHNVNIDFHNEGSFKVAVATHDQRSYIVSSDKEEETNAQEKQSLPLFVSSHRLLRTFGSTHYER